MTREHRPVIVVMGNIASGKTTLSNSLAVRFGLGSFLEDPESNRFLSLMHESPDRWCLANQLWFLVEAAESRRRARISGGILDHSAEEVFPIHSQVFLDREMLTGAEFDLLSDLAQTISVGSPVPDLFLVLDAPAATLVERVKARQRNVDGIPELAYLEEVSARREAFLASSVVPRLKVSSSDYDFRRAEHVDEIAAMVRQVFNSRAS